MTDGAEGLNKNGLQAGLEALNGIHRNLTNAEHRAEARAGEAEAELISLRALRGFVDTEIEVHRARLRAIEDAEKAPKPGET